MAVWHCEVGDRVRPASFSEYGGVSVLDLTGRQGGLASSPKGE